MKRLPSQFSLLWKPCLAGCQIVLIEKSLSDDPLGSPSKVDGPALPGGQEWNPEALKGREGIGCSQGGHPLVDNDGPGSGPVIKHQRIRRLTAVVR